MFFLAKVSYLVASQNGLIKKREDFIIQDESYVGVESAIYSYFEAIDTTVPDSLKIESIKKLKIDYPICSETNFECENWYKVTLASLTHDARDKDKIVLTYLFVNSESFDDAVLIIKAYTTKWLIPTDIQSIVLSGVKAFIPMLEKPIDQINF